MYPTHCLMLMWMLVASLTFNYSARAQIKLQPSIGLNTSSNTISSAMIKTSTRAGFNVSLGSSIHLRGNLFVSPTIQYSVEGYQVSSDISIAYRHSYLRLLIPLEIQVIRNLHLKTGGNIGWLLNERFKTEKSGWSKFENAKSNTDLDAGAIAGLKYHYKQIFFEVMYTHGLTNNNRFPQVNAQGESFQVIRKNRLLQFNVGFTISNDDQI